MECNVKTEQTPNPNAMKFMLGSKLKNEGSATFKSAEEAEGLPIVKDIFGISDAINEVYVHDTYITITQDGSEDWDTLTQKISESIAGNMESHDPEFNSTEESSAQEEFQQENPELNKINAIIDENIRPALQMHGGDLKILKFAEKKLTISYQGACGSCPSAAMGTLYAIKNVLQEQYDPEIEVELG